MDYTDHIQMGKSAQSATQLQLERVQPDAAGREMAETECKSESMSVQENERSILKTE